MKRSIVVASLVVAGIAAAQTDPTIKRIESQLPAGWTLLATANELVLRHDRPCYVKGRAEGPVMTLELRYKLVARWTAAQLAEARATNDKLAADEKAARTRYRIDAIAVVDGRPQPANADERARLAAFDKAQAQAHARFVHLPRCAIGEASLVDSDDTYAALRLDIDPAEAKAEAKRVVEIVDRECPRS